MITGGSVVILAVLFFAARWGWISIGSVIVGVLVGSAFAGSALLAPIGDGVQSTANSLSTSASRTVDRLIK